MAICTLFLEAFCTNGRKKFPEVLECSPTGFKAKLLLLLAV